MIRWRIKISLGLKIEHHAMEAYGEWIVLK
jgi:hypothetical protein